MNKITAYKTSNGCIFENEEEAYNSELTIKLDALINDSKKVVEPAPAWGYDNKMYTSDLASLIVNNKKAFLQLLENGVIS